MEELGAGPSSFMSTHSFEVRGGVQRSSPVKSRKIPRVETPTTSLDKHCASLILALIFFPCIHSEFPLLQLVILDTHPSAVHLWEKPGPTFCITPMPKFSCGNTANFNGLYLSSSTLSRFYFSSPGFSAPSLGLLFSNKFFHSHSSSCSLLSAVW